MSEKMEEFDLFDSEFDYRKLPEISDIEGGGTPDTDTDEYWGGSIPWITPTDLSSNQGPVVYEGEDNITRTGLDEGSARLLPKYSVILTARGTVGESAIMGKEASTNQSCYSLTEKEENPYYLYYGIQQMRPHLESLGVGGTFDSVTRSTLDHFEIPVPPVSEQENIASVLYTVDKHVEALDQRHADLQDLKHALMQDLLTGHTRVDENTTLREEVVSKSEASVIERGEWSESKLKEVARTLRYGDEKKQSDFIEGGKYPVYGANGVIGRSDETNCGNQVSTVTCRGATCGTVHHIDEECWITNNSIIVDADEKAVNQTYLSYYLSHIDLDAYVTGSAQPQITLNLIDKVEISQPPLWEQERIASVLYTVDGMIARTNELRDEYEQLKRGLMQDLISGEVRTSEVIEILPEVSDQS